MLTILEINERYATVQSRINEASFRAGRSPDEITLVAVTKTWPAELVVRAYEVGLRNFGENRPEELAAKRPLVEAVLGKDSDIIWHMIGTVQSRKTALVAGHADVFHALDRLKVSNRLSRDLVENGRLLEVFVEVNLSGESSKAGLDCSLWETDATQRAELRKVITEMVGVPGLMVSGLMTMAPWQAPPDSVRQIFHRTRELGQWLKTAVPQTNWSNLSMGMTDDFEIAIMEGATHIRVGRALFGERSR